MSNQNRHPAGTSAGGQFAPGSAGEIISDLDDIDFASYASVDETGIMRHPSADSVVSSIQYSAEAHPDAASDYPPGSDAELIHKIVVGRQGLDDDEPLDYSQAYQQARSLRPEMDEAEFADRFGRIDFAAGRMLHHAELNDDELDEIDADLGCENHEDAAVEYGRILSREVDLLTKD